MHADKFSRFVTARNEFRTRCAQWAQALPDLAAAQAAMLESARQEPYPIETPIVYNRALDDIGPQSLIRWIVVADNPGRREQESDGQRYLIGPSGKATENFFKRELGLDFRTDAIVINKTPIHSAKTAQLKKLVQLYPDMKPVLLDSQAFMASLVLSMQKALGASVWIMGLSELGPRGIFRPWAEHLLSLYEREPERYSKLYVFNHFSMGSFASDLKKRRLASESEAQAVLRIGMENRVRVFGR